VLWFSSVLGLFCGVVVGRWYVDW